MTAIEMGARVFLPSAGRFLSVDPISGGNANDYTYPVGPINSSDIDGKCSLNDPSDPIGSGICREIFAAGEWQFFYSYIFDGPDLAAWTAIVHQLEDAFNSFERARAAIAAHGANGSPPSSEEERAAESDADPSIAADLGIGLFAGTIGLLACDAAVPLCGALVATGAGIATVVTHVLAGQDWNTALIVADGVVSFGVALALLAAALA